MHSSSRAVLVLGAQGRLGRAATVAYAAAGWRVLAQARRRSAELPRGVEPVTADLVDTAALAAAARGVDTVLYAVNPTYTDWPAQALPLLRHGLNLAQQLGARFMLPGNVYNFGAGMPALLTEDTPPRPSTRKGRIRVAMEDELRAHAERGLDSVVLRAGDFFGSGSGSWFDLVITKDLRRGRLVYPGPLDRPHAWAYLPDLAKAFVAASQAEPRRGVEVLHFAGHGLTGRQLLTAIEEVAQDRGLRPAGAWRHAGVPWRLMRAGGVLVPMWREVAEMAYLWQVPHTLDGTALQRRVGPLPTTPLRVALQASLTQLGLLQHPPVSTAAA